MDELEKKSPCWEGYVQRGMKPGKDGNPVPNCVPVEKAELDDALLQRHGKIHHSLIK